MKKLISKATLRATAKMPLAVAVTIGAFCSLPFQIGLGLLGKRTTAIRDFFMNRAAGLMSIKVEFNKKSKPLLKKDVIFSVKHLARADAFVVPHMPNADFMMTDHFFKTPVFGPILKVASESAGFIPTSQTSAGKKRDLGIIIQRQNSGINFSLFQEGTCPGAEVLECSKGSLEPLFGEPGIDENGNEVTLNKEVAVQPITLKVKSIDGENVLNSPDKWDKYTMIQDKRSLLVRIFDRMKAREIIIEAQALEPIYARDFADAAEMSNFIRDQFIEHVNPGQAEIRRRKEFLEEREALPHQTYW